MKVRPMQREDAESVAVLATQLGYPSSTADLALRIPGVIGRGDATALVAEADQGVVGWAQVELHHSLVDDRSAQVMALVVGEDHRGRGIGEELMRACEAWAAAHGAEHLRVASRVTRVGAHRFYERIGYTRTKTSQWFARDLV